MADHDIGDLVYLDATFANDAGAPLDPAALDLKVRKPDGTEVTYAWPGAAQVVHVSTGVFRGEITPDQAGVWGYRWKVPPGSGQSAEPGQFFVRPEFYALLRPSVDAVAALLRARTKDDSNNEVGTFNDGTRPTAAQVESLIDHATRTVLAAVPIGAPAAEYGDAVRALAAIRAAMLVELSYFPEQISGDNSAYAELKRLYDDGLGGFGGLLTGQDPAIAGIASIPIRSSVMTEAEWEDPEPPLV